MGRATNERMGGVMHRSGKANSDPQDRGPEFIGISGKRWELPGIPRTLKRLGCLVAILVLAPCFVVFFIFDYVRPNEYGIKEVKIGVDRGIHQTVYAPGYWLIKPFGMEKMHHFPRQVQVLELTSTEKAARDITSHAYDRAAKIQTSDGFFVDVDLTILYRIVDPYLLMTTLGPGVLYLTNGILPKAEPVLKQALGELKTEDFYNSPKRVEKSEKARAALDEQVAPKGLKVDQVLIRYFKYSDEIQKNIEAKKLQDQLVFKNQAEAKANTEEAATKKTMQEGEMLVKVEIEGGDAYRTEKTAETELYTRKKAAEGKLLVRTAEAEATELKNQAMQLAGGDRKVALEMAKVLEGLDYVVVPTGGEHGMNPLDLQSVLKLFGLQPGAISAGNPVRPVESPPKPPPPPPPPAVEAGKEVAP